MRFRITDHLWFFITNLCFYNTDYEDDSWDNLIEKLHDGIESHKTKDSKCLNFGSLESFRVGNNYFCTFSCGEISYSRNDWARHEITAHFQQEIWLCDEESDGICNKGFYIEENYRLHLKNSHKISNIDEYDIDARHIPANFQGKFWCGFCERCYTGEKGVHGWSAREKHVGDHFEGQNKYFKWTSPIYGGGY